MGFRSPALLFIILNHIIGLVCLSQDLIRKDLFDFQQSQLDGNFKFLGLFLTCLKTVLVGIGVWLHSYNVTRFHSLSSFPSSQGGGKNVGNPLAKEFGGPGPETALWGHTPLSTQTTSPSSR